MADIQTELLNAIQQLIQQIKNGSLSAGASKPKLTNAEKLKAANTDPAKTQADRQRMEKVLKEGTKALKDAFKSQENYGRDFKVAGVAFQNAVSKLSLKSFDELPKRLNKLTEQYEFNFKNKEDIDKKIAMFTEENIKAAKGLYDQLINLNHASEDYQKKYDELIVKIEKTGFTVEEAGSDLISKQKALGKALNEVTIATDKAAKAQENMAAVSALAAAAILGFANKSLEATKAAAKFGVEITPLGIGAAALGMSAEELGKIQNENIQGLHKAGTSFGDFNTQLISGAYDLAAFTGNFPEGARVTANLFRNFRMLSSDTSQQSKFIKESTAIFKQMHDTVGLTSEQFIALTQSIDSNNDIQVNMYRLGQGQRIQALLDIQAQTAQLRNYGLLDSEAQNVIATFASLGAQGPKERRKQAAQLMAVGGALGMGDEARQLAVMLQRGDTSSPEFAKLTASIQRKAQTQYANVKGTAGEFAQYALTNLPGVQQILGQQGPVAALAMRQGMETPAQVARDAALHAGVAKPSSPEEQDRLKSMEVQDKIKTAVISIDDQMRGMFGKGLIGVVTSVLALLKGKDLLKGLLGMGGRGAAGAVLGAEAGGVGAAGAAAGGGALAGAATAAAGVTVAAAAGYAAGTALNWLPKLFGSDRRFSDMIVDAVSEDYDPNAPANKPGTAGYEKEMIVRDMLKARGAVESGKLDEKRQKEMMATLDALTTQLAVMNNKDPSKAVEDLHKTLKNQHQESKDMTQEQTDVLKKQKQVKEVKTSQRLGTSS